jgi:HAD superfamily hydrolase (TIGR01509 family)
MKCLIFDLDGTLVDSEQLCNLAFLNLLPELDENIDVITNRYRGKKLATIFEDIDQRLDFQLPIYFDSIYRAEVAALFECHLQPTAGVVTALSNLDNPKCIASSGPLKKIKHSLSLTGLDIFFGNNIFSSYEVQSWKPEPGLFIHAAQVMGYSPSDCIVIEDSEVGMAAADAAGMHSILYSPMGSGKSTYEMRSMSELSELIASI